MREILEWYLSVGCAIYIVFFIKDAVSGFKTLIEADVASVARGALTILVWPYILWYMELR